MFGSGGGGGGVDNYLENSEGMQICKDSDFK